MAIACNSSDSAMSEQLLTDVSESTTSPLDYTFGNTEKSTAADINASSVNHPQHKSDQAGVCGRWYAAACSWWEVASVWKRTGFACGAVAACLTAAWLLVEFSLRYSLPAPPRAILMMLPQMPLADGQLPAPACLDGTPYGVYFQPSTSGSTAWTVYLEGGGWVRQHMPA